MRKGFSLVELSIVLVIIGLLIGGVLKGKAMIDNTKVKRVKSDIDGIVAAVYAYQDRFGALPGDDAIVRTFGGIAIPAGDGNGLLNTAAGGEPTSAWRALIGAGFVSGDVAQTTEATVAKRSPFGGMYLFRYGTQGNQNGNYILVNNIPSNVIQELDEKFDDGVWNTGDIQSGAAYPAVPANANLSWFAF